MAIGPPFSGNLFNFFSRHPSKQRPSFSRHCPRSSSVCALYVALSSSLTFPLYQRIRPFTTDKALSGPPLHRDTAILPQCPPVGGVQGWSAPALNSTWPYSVTCHLATQQLSNNTPHKHLCKWSVGDTHYRCSDQVCCRHGVLLSQTLHVLARIPAILMSWTQTQTDTLSAATCHKQPHHTLNFCWLKASRQFTKSPAVQYFS